MILYWFFDVLVNIAKNSITTWCVMFAMLLSDNIGVYATNDGMEQFVVRPEIGDHVLQQKLQNKHIYLNPEMYTINRYSIITWPATNNEVLNCEYKNNGFHGSYLFATKPLNLQNMCEVTFADLMSIGIKKILLLNILNADGDGRIIIMDGLGTLQAIGCTIPKQKIMWSKIVLRDGINAMHGCGVSIYGDIVYCTTITGDLWGLHHVNGDVIYRIKLPCGSDCAPVIQGDMVYFVSITGRIVCLNVITGKVVWQTECIYHGNIINGVQKCIIDRNNVIASVGGELVAVDIKSGIILWQTKISVVPYAFFGHRASIQFFTLQDNVIYAADFSSTLCAVRADNGDIIWKKDNIAIADIFEINGNSIFFVTKNGLAMAVNKDNGDIGWINQIPKTVGERLIGSVVTSAGLVVSISDGTICALSLQDGKICYLNKLPHIKGIVSRPFVFNNCVYFISSDSKLICWSDVSATNEWLIDVTNEMLAKKFNATKTAQD